MLRRKNEVGGYNYFLAMLQNNRVDGWVDIETFASSVMLLQAGLLLINCLYIFWHFCLQIHILGCLVISHFCKI